MLTSPALLLDLHLWRTDSSLSHFGAYVEALAHFKKVSLSSYSCYKCQDSLISEQQHVGQNMVGNNSEPPSDARRGSSSPPAVRQTSSALLRDKSLVLERVEEDAGTGSADNGAFGSTDLTDLTASSLTNDPSVLSDLRDSVTSASMGAKSAQSLPRRLGQSSFSHINAANDQDSFNNGSFGSLATGGSRSSRGMGMMNQISGRISMGTRTSLSNLSVGGSRNTRASMTMNKLNLTDIGIIGRGREKKMIRDAFARVSLSNKGQGGKATGDGDGDGDDSAARSKDSLSDHVKQALAQQQAETETETKAEPQSKEQREGRDTADDDGTIPVPVLDYPELVLVHGYSGCGKTVLVENALPKSKSLKKQKSRMIFLQGKFDLNQHSGGQPYSGFISAFSDLAEELGDIGNGDSIKQAINKAIGEDEALITQLIPDLDDVLGVENSFSGHSSYDDEANDYYDSNRVEGSIEAKNRLLFILKRFIASIGRDGCPLVLFLDDLQWADQASLDLLESLVTDRSSGSTMIVGTYRSNEVDKEHILAEKIDKIRAADRKEVVDIHLDNLRPEDVNTLVATVLRQPEEKVRTLSDVVKEKTLGNPFHAISFIQALEQEGLLSFNLGTFKWSWDVEKINSKYVTANVADLMKQKLRALQPEAQTVLEIAACIGCEFDQRTLELAADAFPPDFEQLALEKYKGITPSLEAILEESVQEGVLRKLDSATYCYVHDQIQAAAFSLIAEEDRQSLQARVGKSLVDLASPDELESLLLVAIDLCNCDPSVFSTPEDKVSLVSLNLRAGKQAMQNSAFTPAASYCMSGIGALALGDLSFEDHRQLYIDLYGLASQAHYCKGDTDRMNECLDEILSHGYSLTTEDRFPLQMIRCKSLYVRHEYDEAWALAQQTLKDIGYKPFPSKVSMPFVLKELLKTKRLVKKYRSKITDLPLMDDKNRLRAVKIFRAMQTLTFQHDQSLFPIVVWRWLRWTLKYGLAGINCVAIASHSVILLSMGDYKNAYELAKLTESLLERLKPMDQMAYAKLSTDGFVKPWRESVQKLINVSVNNYEIGLSTGDVEAAMWHVVYVGAFSYIGGKNLLRLEDALGPQLEKIQFYQQDAIFNFLVPYRQTVLNLLGYADDPLVLTGIAMDQEQLLNKITADGQQTAINVVHSQRLELAYLFGRYRLAGDILDDLKPWESIAPAYVGIFRTSLFQGLTCYAIAASEDRRKWMKRGDAFLKKIEKWVKHGNVNTVHMVHLLRAERAWLQGKTAVAENQYGEAISVAGRNGFVQDKALAHERFMEFHLKQQDDDYWAKYHFNKALEAWGDWGATAKADHLQIARGKLRS